MTEPMKTAEHILLEKVGKLALSGLKWKSLDDRKQLVLQAMQEYADQEKSAERERIKNIVNKIFEGCVVDDWSGIRLRKEIHEKLIDSL